MAEQKIIDIEPRFLKMVQSLFARQLPFKQVWAFGSRVKFTARQSSDLDCVVFGATDNEIAKAQEVFDESEVPFEVQLLNWETIPEDFKENIKKEYFVLRKESDWGEFKLGELGFIGRGKSKHRPRNDISLYGGSYPFVQTGDIKAANLYVTEYSQTYNNKGLAQSKLWEKGTLCLTIAANIGETAILAMKACFPDSIVGFIADQKKADTKFIKYYIDTLKKQMSNVSQGATQENMSLEKISLFTLLIPQIKTQRKIASILSTYDDLIENNNKRIKILEEMAQMLYKEWFINFKFPNHQNTKFVDSELGRIPEGWEYKELNKVVRYNIGGGWGKEEIDEKHNIPAYVIRGADIPNIKVNQVQFVPFRFHKKSNFLNRQILEKDIVFEVSGGGKEQPVGRALLITKEIKDQFSDKIICASFCKLMRIDSTQIIPELVYLHFLEIYTNGHIDKYQVQSTGITNFKFSVFLKQEKILIPNKEIQGQFDNIIKSLYKKKDYLGIKTQNLRKTRDLLLPRLISGEISVENLEVKIDDEA